MSDTFRFVLITPDGVEVLYSTSNELWAERVASHLREDWQARKPEYEGFKNSREVIITGVDNAALLKAMSQPDSRRSGIKPKSSVVGQRFPTVSAAAAHLGVTVGMLTKSFKDRECTVRGVTLKYLDEYLADEANNVRD